MSERGNNELEHEVIADGEHLLAFPPRIEGGDAIILPAVACPVCRTDRAEQRIKELERERDKARPVLEAARELRRCLASNDIPEQISAAEGVEQVIRAHDAARAAEDKL